jgi:hypothetical protein
MKPGVGDRAQGHGRRAGAGPGPALALAAVVLAIVAAAPAAAEEPLPALAERVRGLERRDGLLTLHLDPRRGRVFLELPPPADASGEVGRYLYVEGLVTGLGSNPVGLDRGQLGDTQLVVLRRLGGKLLVEAPNLRFRAAGAPAPSAEARAVAQSFATSVLWAGEVVAEDDDGRALVDLTPFVVRDAHGVAAALADAGQGRFELDEARSAVDPAACLAFPDNLELEATLTFRGADPGPLVRSIAPLPQAVTLVQHHSLVRLPDAGYRPRRFDPRSGSFAVEYADYSAPLAAPIAQRLLVRHRLARLDPGAAGSPVAEPIVYHVDPGIPEPVRGAVVEGASWWAEAFARAGWGDAFRVELLPEGAHPLDVRYNVIQWVHRSTRGWSYGGGVVDPRTGEMIKGHVSLGSLRVRHDRLLFEGLAGADASGSGAADDPVVLALARIRQLAAHEVGHTLGFAHNFAASTYGRASVMDYPAPLVEVAADGTLDFSRAYASGVGEWDVQAVRYAYGDFPPGADEERELEAIVADSLRRGLLFLSDQDARRPGLAHPRAALWDNGEDPVAGLEQALRVRAVALERFGAANVAAGTPLSRLHEVLVPVYLHHRYQLEAAAKLLGGLEYAYALRGDGQPPARAVDEARQRRALQAIVALLRPEALDLPEPLLALLLPPAYGEAPGPERFAGASGPAFDSLAAAATAAAMAADAVLHRERAARLVDFHRRDPSLPGLEEALDALVAAAFAGEAPGSPRHEELRRVVQQVLVRSLLALAADPAAAPGVRARVEGRVRELAAELQRPPRAPAPRAERAHREFLAAEVQRFLARGGPQAGVHPAPPAPPPGEPIGGFDEGCAEIAAGPGR